MCYDHTHVRRQYSWPFSLYIHVFIHDIYIYIFMCFYMYIYMYIYVESFCALISCIQSI